MAAREIPVCLLTEFRLRPWETNARARLRVLRSYMWTLLESDRVDTQQKADVQQNVDVRFKN
ncbi:hypothetical protein GCM10023336_46970 [Streptomyces similanensis]|uniref:Integrase n=1 Tax=Streptomyces similanensis TaxID=1274988 RepID=A0ABP9KTS0_9ACTN